MLLAVRIAVCMVIRALMVSNDSISFQRFFATRNLASLLMFTLDPKSVSMGAVAEMLRATIGAFVGALAFCARESVSVEI